MSKLDYPRRSAGLFRTLTEAEAAALGPALVPSDVSVAVPVKVAKAVRKMMKAKPGRPAKKTGDPKKDARNKAQRERMAQKRKA